MSNVSGSLFIIAAPSGTGKTSLVKKLIQNVDSLEVSVSHTTRSQRPGEIEGKDYFFIDNDTYQNLLDKNEFLEHALVYGKSYGTSRSWVLDKLQQGIDIILEIDWQGAQQIKSIIPDCISIFILPPSLESLRERLRGRGQDALEVIEKRMEKAQSEISHCSEFDYLLVNDDFDQTLSSLEMLVKSSRLQKNKQQQRFSSLIKELLR